MDQSTGRKWDAASRWYDFMTFADDRRFAADKRRLFAKIKGTTLMVGVGTGNDLKFFPSVGRLDAIDISMEMLERAKLKAKSTSHTVTFRQLDVCDLDYPDCSFDTVVTACTFCSVPRPVSGLRELHRVLRPGGQILMFEHVRSAIGPLGTLLDLMTPLTRLFGPDLNRDTVGNMEKAGFRLRRVENVYLDIVKMIEAVKP